MIRPYIACALLLFLLTGCSQPNSPDPRDQLIQDLRDQIAAMEQANASHPAITATRPVTRPAAVPADIVSAIRAEGFDRSQIPQTLSQLTDVIGPRLTGSANLKRANQWTREQLEKWGLEKARVEPWGDFGRGWSLKRFSAQVVAPQNIMLRAYPKAWSPGVAPPVTAEVVWMDPRSAGDLDQHKGKLAGKIVLWGARREIPPRFDGPATRASDADLLRLANAAPGDSPRIGLARAMTPDQRQAMLAQTPAGRSLLKSATTRSTTTTASSRSTQPASAPSPARVLAFLMKEGAAVVVTPATTGEGGTLFLASAAIPDIDPKPTTVPKAWSPDCPPIPPQISLAAEDFNRLARMIAAGEKIRMTVDIQVDIQTSDPVASNTLAEIPGTDLKDQVVMIGAHLDSWHVGTGATDNAVGVAATMEAVRILKALKVQPRRTIRIALWTGEEQGLLGSKAYVTKHLGYAPTTQPTSKPTAGPTVRPTTGPATKTALVRLKGYETLSVYFNHDNGTGKIRGIHLQGNESARPYFRQWLIPFADLGASTISITNTGGTDHIPFDAIGLPAFQFIQDPIDYWTRTHHSTDDVYDRAVIEDLKQNAVIMAAFIYQAAMMDERFPRKP